MREKVQGRLIAIADDLNDWRIEPELMKFVKRIETIYWYDASLASYFCSFEACYELYPVDSRVIFTDSVYALRDADYDLVTGELDKIVIDNSSWEMSVYSIADVNSMIRATREAKTKYAFPTTGGAAYKLNKEEISSLTGITYRKYYTERIPCTLPEYVEAVREAHQRGELI